VTGNYFWPLLAAQRKAGLGYAPRPSGGDRRPSPDTAGGWA
jgi:hypothetical protein